jgi:hypothetical protein
MNIRDERAANDLDEAAVYAHAISIITRHTGGVQVAENSSPYLANPSLNYNGWGTLLARRMKFGWRLAALPPRKYD